MLKELYQQLVADAKAAVGPKLIELPDGDCIGDAYRLCAKTIVADLKRDLPKALVVCCD